MGERVVIFGSRGWVDDAAVSYAVACLDAPAIVIHGGAKGVDQMAESAAKQMGHHTAVVQPLWDVHGRAAGPIRNDAMLRLRPNLAIGFWDGKSPGTKGMIDKVIAAGISLDLTQLPEEGVDNGDE